MKRRVAPRSDGSYVFPTKRLLAVVAAFLPAAVACLCAYNLWRHYQGHAVGDSPAFLWAVVVVSAALATAALLLLRADVIIGDAGITRKGPFRTQHLSWDDVTWAAIGHVVILEPGGAQAAAPAAVAVARGAADGWNVTLGDGRGTKLIVSGLHLRDYEHARLVMRRYLRERVDEGLIEDRIGFL